MPRGFTPLHFAARHARLALVQCLVEHGADVNATTDEEGLSVVHLALEKERIDVVDYLVSKGAGLKALMWRGVSMLQPAARDGKLEIVKYFIENGADVNSAAKGGVTLLHDAASRDQLSVLEYLLENGASVNAKDKDGRTAMYYALFSPNKKCGRVYPTVFLLTTSGAQWDISCEEELATLTKRHHKELETASSEGDSIVTRTIRWQNGLRACVKHWEEERKANKSTLLEVPVEVIERGEDSVFTYLAEVTKSGHDQLILRRKLCVVGPTQWGKTSFVKSLTSLQPTLVDIDDRTIGIDLFAHAFTQGSGNGKPRKRHEISFWDFAGQDEYQVAHAMFFSKRTLYVLCIDLERYQRALKQADHQRSPREAEHFMARFLRTNVFRWVRAIVSRQADAEFVVVGTKMDTMKSDKQADLIWGDLRGRLQDWVRMYAEEIDHEFAASGIREGSEEHVHYQTLKNTLSHLFDKEWIKVSSKDADSVLRARTALEFIIASSDRSFVMPLKYTRVLEALRARREKTARLSNASRIANLILPVRALCKELMDEIADLNDDECRTILETLHDVGDLLWYQHEASGVMKDTVIIDPTLVLDFVREVITHEHAKRATHLPPPYVEEGRLTHEFMRQLTLWKDVDEELTFAFKQLLQYFQLAYPADNAEMDWDSDLIVPTYWKVNKASTPQRRLTKQNTMMARHGVLPGASHYCWEYEFSAEVADTIFEQFAVQSYSSLLKRRVGPKFIEAFVHGDCTALITLTSRESIRDVIRIEVAVTNSAIGWQYLRYYVMALETVLDSFPGLIVSRYVVDTKTPKARRHKLSEAVQALQDATWMGRDESTVREKMPWLPRDMGWYMEKSWLHPSALQKLRTEELVREAVNKVEVLKKLVIADDTRRMYPALWTLKYEAIQKRVELRMLSDLSGDCFHDPIEINVPPAFLAKHSSLIKSGISILSNVVPEVVSFGILQKVIGLVSPGIVSMTERAQTMYNLIDQLKLSEDYVAEPSKSGKLSPRATVALLRDLLKLHNSSFDELTISDLAQLQCAATAEGHFVWANRKEIMELGDKLTPCDLEDVAHMKRSLSSASTASSSSSGPPTPPCSLSRKRVSRHNSLRFRLSVIGIKGLTAWDWRKVYCKWQLIHPNSSTPIASGSTPIHSDYASAPSWDTVDFALSRVASLDMLRQSRLSVRVKRPSRCLGIVKCVGVGAVTLTTFVPRETDEGSDVARVFVPLDGDENSAACEVVVRISS